MSEVSSLTKEQIVGVADAGSPKGQERLAIHRKALDAQSRQDLDGMFAAYQRAVVDRAEFEELWAKAACSLGNKIGETCPVAAIRDVALAAIGLARDVALKGRETESEA